MSIPSCTVICNLQLLVPIKLKRQPSHFKSRLCRPLRRELDAGLSLSFSLSHHSMLRSALTVNRTLSSTLKYNSRPIMTQSPALPISSPAALDALASGEVESRYRPFLLTEQQKQEEDWVAALELETVAAMASASERKLKILVLYGSLREREWKATG